VALEAALSAERSEREAMASDDRQLRRDFERMLAAAVVAREEEAERRVAAAQQQAQAASDAAARAEARAEAAELAKIELTMQLAQAAEARANDIDTHPTELPHAPSGRGAGAFGGPDLGRASEEEEAVAAGGGGGGGDGMGAGVAGSGGSSAEVQYQMEVMSQQIEEAELAASVQTRRAATAEAELSRLKAELADAQKQVHDLSWQIKMSFEPQTIGGAGSRNNGGSGSGWLDIVGCGANFTRK
jgi:hypothetical protein